MQDFNCPLSHDVVNHDQMTLDLEKPESNVGLKVKTNKPKALSLIGHHTPPNGMNGKRIGDIGQFEYLGSTVAADCSSELRVAKSI